MQTIRLKINDRIYNQVIGYLNRFSEDEIQVVPENEKYVSV